MALFKKKLTLDEILAGIDNLSDEEKLKLGEQMKELYKAGDEPEAEESYPEDEGEKSVEGGESEGLEENEESDAGDETAQEEGVDTGESEAEAEEEASEGEEHIEKETEELAAIRSDIAELKKVVASIAARFDADADNEEEGEDIAWGVGAKEAKVDTPTESETEKCRRKYFNF